MFEDDIVDLQTDDDFLNLYKMRDINDFVELILQRFASLSIYIITPEDKTAETIPLKIPANENYTIYDYGNRLVIGANDLYATSLFSTTSFLAAIYQGLELLLENDIQEAAILGDPRAKHYIWDMCERKKQAQQKSLSLINFTAPEGFVETREAVLRYIKSNGMTPVIHAPLQTKLAKA